ncbi:MAG: hypothetical protein RBG13Loki_4115 [Promethearchaeota archaeon CR_4]|nr:MAG: hypothetical protein RBG13Loki_4115 [Candidatus Lokiarchaeota archaeon CR_4]
MSVQFFGIHNGEMPFQGFDHKLEPPEHPLPYHVDPYLFVLPVLGGSWNPKSPKFHLGCVSGLPNDSLEIAAHGTAPEEKEVVVIQETECVGSVKLTIEKHHLEALSLGK